jgi:hypothetical protein
LAVKGVREELLKAVDGIQRQAQGLETDRTLAPSDAATYRKIVSWLRINNVKWQDIWPPGIPIPSFELSMNSEQSVAGQAASELQREPKYSSK